MTKEELLNYLPQVGKVEWIGIRPEKNAALQSLESVQISVAEGLSGDHYAGKSGKRQVTLIQKEHLDVVAELLGKNSIDPGLTRRNIVVSGINLLAFRDRQFKIGEVVLEGTGSCHPCSKMETNLGAGGYNAMRGHGGITAKIIQGGNLKLGDSVQLQSAG